MVILKNVWSLAKYFLYSFVEIGLYLSPGAREQRGPNRERANMSKILAGSMPLLYINW